MRNNLEELNATLYEQLEKLKNTKSFEIKSEVNRANGMCQLSSQIIKATAMMKTMHVKERGAAKKDVIEGFKKEYLNGLS